MSIHLSIHLFIHPYMHMIVHTCIPIWTKVAGLPGLTMLRSVCMTCRSPLLKCLETKRSSTATQPERFVPIDFSQTSNGFKSILKFCITVIKQLFSFCEVL